MKSLIVGLNLVLSFVFFVSPAWPAWATLPWGVIENDPLRMQWDLNQWKVGSLAPETYRLDGLYLNPSPSFPAPVYTPRIVHQPTSRLTITSTEEYAQRNLARLRGELKNHRSQLRVLGWKLAWQGL